MKKYYCPTCRQFKSRWQLQRVDDTRTVFFACKWCHNSNIYKTEDVLDKLIGKTLSENDFNNRHRSWV